MQPVPNSRLFDVNYSDPDPARAQRIANAYADAFVAASIDKRFQETQTAKIFLEDKMQQLKGKLQDSEAALIDFAKKQQVISLGNSQEISREEHQLPKPTSQMRQQSLQS